LLILVGKELEVHVKVNAYEANRKFGFQVDKPFPGQMLWLLEPMGAPRNLPLPPKPNRVAFSASRRRC